MILLLLALQEIPKVTVPGVTIELVAREPEIVTPTGIAVGRDGRVFVIENNTHQRKEKGPASDRIRLMDRSGKFTTYAEGFRDAMSLAVNPDGDLVLATRGGIWKLVDPDKNGVSTEAERPIVIAMETKGDYPHNGLAGLAFGPDGWMYFSLGENLGEKYTLTGTDGARLSGGGEGGSLYRCRPDGSRLERIGTGVWNCFSMVVDRDGVVFAADDDPDASPPCRLLQVGRGSDFGFRFRLGRDGTHPFQAWNGERPGTLPMVRGLPQSPCGMVEVATAPLGRCLLITTWAGHVIQRHRLTPKGAGFVSEADDLVVGGRDFRPVGIAADLDGTLLVTDWVKEDYPVHGHGKVWRIRPGDALPPAAPAPWSARAAELRRLHDAGGAEDKLRAAAEGDESPFVRREAILRLSSPASCPPLVELLAHEDVWLRAAAIEMLGRIAEPELLLSHASSTDARLREGLVVAMRRRGDASLRRAIPAFLRDADPLVRRAVLQWIGEERLTEFADQIKEAVGADEDLFLAYLAAVELLDKGTPTAVQWGSAREIPEPVLLLSLRDASLAPAARSRALRGLRPAALPLDELKRLLDDPGLRVEAVRTLVARGDIETLKAVAADAALPDDVRADAVSGLGPDAVRFIENVPAVVARAAMRAVGGQADSAGVDWEATEPGGDPVAGERLFYHPQGPACHQCHRVAGRGGRFGTDLSHLGRGTERRKILESILHPSREVAPMYVGWMITLNTGEELTGRIVEETSDWVRLMRVTGEVKMLQGHRISDRRPSGLSPMPEGLHTRLTREEFRDLVAFLESRK